MSSEEMREYCVSLCSFNVRIQVRLKNGQEITVGRITGVQQDRFNLVGEDNVEQQVRFAWVARIKNA